MGPREGGARSRSPLLVLLFLLACLGLPAPRAWAADEDEALRSELLAGGSDGEWGGILENRVLKKDPEVVARILSPLFWDPTLRDRNEACVAYTAAYLADHPTSGAVLLGSFILRRAHRDDDFVVRMRNHLKKYGGGWQRLKDHAKAVLASTQEGNGDERRAAMWFLSRDRTADSIWYLYDRAKEGLGVPGGLENAGDPVAMELLEAFRHLLSAGGRFTSPKDAVDFLAGHEGADRETLLDALLQRDGAEADPAKALAISYGLQLIGRTDRAEDLVNLVDVEQTPYVELRQAAMRRALQIGSKPEEPWRALICTVLHDELDTEVLRGALLLMEKVADDYRKSPEVAEAIANCVLGRLQRPAEAADRARMAAILGDLGVASVLLKAMANERLAQSEDTGVLGNLILAAGKVEGIPVEVLLGHYRDHPGNEPADVWVRLTVADALGHPAFVQKQPESASAALRAILTGEGDDEIEREAAPEVRLKAIGRLQHAWAPGAESAAVLGAIAEGRDDKEADRALAVIGILVKLPQPDPHATAALASFVRGSAPEERRRRALSDLGNLGAQASDELKALVRDAVREVLESPRSGSALKADAAAAAAKLADADALRPVIDWWTEDPAARSRLLVDLVGAVAGDGASGDGRIEVALRRVGEAGSWDLALETARTLEEAHPRYGLRLARARIHLARARAADRDEAGRLQDLEAADGLLQTASSAEGPAQRDEAILLNLEVVKSLASLGKSGPAFAARIVRAVEDASGAASRDVWVGGLDLVTLLEGAALDAPLAERFQRARDKLDSLVKG